MRVRECVCLCGGGRGRCTGGESASGAGVTSGAGRTGPVGRGGHEIGD